MGCAKCGASSIKSTATCSKCNAGFGLCQNCINSWKTYACPSCKTTFASWKGI
ncbi:MAG: hypothetical protein ABII22_02095 [Candidatus Micrarchaeota archaeon]